MNEVMFLVLCVGTIVMWVLVIVAGGLRDERREATRLYLTDAIDEAEFLRRIRR